jgi:hypothetical protein
MRSEGHARSPAFGQRIAVPSRSAMPPRQVNTKRRNVAIYARADKNMPMQVQSCCTFLRAHCQATAWGILVSNGLPQRRFLRDLLVRLSGLQRQQWGARTRQAVPLTGAAKGK